MMGIKMGMISESKICMLFKINFLKEHIENEYFIEKNFNVESSEVPFQSELIYFQILTFTFHNFHNYLNSKALISKSNNVMEISKNS